MTYDNDFYEVKGVYDYRRETAYPWAIDWPILKYKIIGKNDMNILRKVLFKGLEDEIPQLKDLPEEELQLPYEKYIVPEYLFGGGNLLDNNYQPKTYNPFDVFNNIQSRERTVLPYADLFTLSVEDEKAILEFVNKHGLLGLFFHRYKNLPLVNTAEGYDINDTIKATFQYKNKKVRGRNKKIELEVNRGLWVGKPEDKEGLIPVSPKNINDTYFPFQLNLYEFGDFLLTYYYKIDFRFAKLGTINLLDWWPAYCEPLPLFIQEAKMFQEISSTIHELDEQEDKAEREISLSKIVFQLRNNLENIQPIIKYSEGESGNSKDINGLVNSWEFPSLISAYYLMLYLKISGNRKTRLCIKKSCRRPFFQNRPDNSHCSEKCQMNNKSQRSRDKKKGNIEDELNTRKRYLPENIKYLLVMGLPANEEMLFKYSDTGTYINYPFVKTASAFYPGTYKKINEILDDRENILKSFKKDGIFVVDAIESNRFKENAPCRIKSIINKYASRDTNIILVGISDEATNYLKERGYRIIHLDPIPYPDKKEKQDKYRKMLKSILKQVGFYDD